MKIKFYNIISLVIFICFTNNILAQQTKTNIVADLDLKEKLYTDLKPKVNSFSKKDFDALFFDFFQKQSDDKIILTKEEYYNYTISIAIYSAKLGLLYKDQKETANKTKQEWYDKNYQDYYNSKQKK